MALNISGLVTPWIVFIFVLILVVVAVIILTVLERKLGRQIILKKEKESYYTKKIREVRQLEGKPSEFLVALDGLAREFLSDKFGVDKNEKYADLIVEFEKKHNRSAVEFCRRMQEAFYAGESLDRGKLDFLFKNFDFLVGTERKLRVAELRKEEEKRRKEMKGLEVKAVAGVKNLFGSKNKEMNQDVVKYLVEGQKRGFSLNLLRAKLREKKYGDEDIDNALDYLNFQKKEESPVEKEEDVQTPKFTELKPIVLEETQVKKPKTRVRESKEEKNIRSLDDLSRLKEKIKIRKSGSEVFKAKTGLR